MMRQIRFRGFNPLYEWLYGLLFDLQVVNYGCRKEVMTPHGRETNTGRK